MILDKKSQENEKIFNEINIFKLLKHPNLIEYYDSFKYKNNKYYCIVMEYADDGDLFKKISKAPGPIPEQTIWNWFIQICLGLRYIHEHKIIHRDIKSQNIFMFKNGYVKLGDFGISKVLKNTCDFAETSVGTPYFLSPEICQGLKYSFKSDIWMLGCVLYEMVTRQRPFEGNNLPSLMMNILNQDFKPITDDYSDELKSLIGSLLIKSPKQRPSIHEILDLDFIIDKAKSLNINLEENTDKENSNIISDNPLLRTFTVNDTTNNEETFNEDKKNEIVPTSKMIYSYQTNNVVNTDDEVNDNTNKKYQLEIPDNESESDEIVQNTEDVVRNSDEENKESDIKEKRKSQKLEKKNKTTLNHISPSVMQMPRSPGNTIIRTTSNDINNSKKKSNVMKNKGKKVFVYEGIIEENK